jgi:hypothetical protein
MPGGFTHFAVVRQLGTDITLTSIKGMPRKIADSLLFYSKYLELGAVSPDLPYLVLFSKKAADWGNALHHQSTVETLRAGIRMLPALIPEGKERDMATAWLFGYASHVVADMISHPVVTKKVGEYEKNKAKHRVCELSQDTYIFNKYFQDDITDCEYLDTGVRACTKDGRKGDKLAPFLRDFWTAVLKDVYPGMDTPDTDYWFRQYVSLIDGVAEGDNLFVSCIRGALKKTGFIYPKKIDMKYVDKLLEPSADKPIIFDSLFERFQEETKKVWGEMAQAITKNDAKLLTLRNGDLDTGIDLADKKTSIFWENKRSLA